MSETEQDTENEVESTEPNKHVGFRAISIIGIISQICLLLSLFLIIEPIINYLPLFGIKTILSFAFLFLSCVVCVVLAFLTKSFTYSQETNFNTILLLVGVQVFLSLIMIGVSAILYLKWFDSLLVNDFNYQFVSHIRDNSPIVHQFQQEYQCCGVHLNEEWKSSTVDLSNPLSSWFYHITLSDDYIDEARRLFTLPWSCCKQPMKDCEHLAFERISIQYTDKKSIITDELQLVEHLMGVKPLHDASGSVNHSSCENYAIIILHDLRFKVIGILVGFASMVLLTSASNVIGI